MAMAIGRDILPDYKIIFAKDIKKCITFAALYIRIIYNT